MHPRAAGALLALAMAAHDCDSWRVAAFWSVEAVFTDGAPSIRTAARGEPMRLGPLDARGTVLHGETR